MKVDRKVRGKVVQRNGAGLGWPTVFLIAVLGPGLQQACAGINEWTNLGPYGGPVKALVSDPQNTRTMYAATYDKVFKTVDGAGSWLPASTGLTGYPIFSGLAIDYQNTSTLYA